MNKNTLKGAYNSLLSKVLFNSLIEKVFNRDENRAIYKLLSFKVGVSYWVDIKGGVQR